MALTSMTGFGRGSAKGQGIEVVVELSAVNRKQFDARISLPRSLLSLESRLHESLRQKISRGHITGTVRVDAVSDGTGMQVRVNEALARATVTAVRQTAKKLKLPDDLGARILLDIADFVVLEDAARDSERVWPILKRAVHAALRDLVGMRKTEGANLEKDLRARLKKLEKLEGKIRHFAPQVSEKMVRALRDRLDRAGVELELQDPLLQREIVLIADRVNIDEELVRLDSHLAHAESIMKMKKPVGRTLDFVCQEMFREINTIGSKSNDASISGTVIDFKAELESLREQVQNVE